MQCVRGCALIVVFVAGSRLRWLRLPAQCAAACVALVLGWILHAQNPPVAPLKQNLFPGPEPLSAVEPVPLDWEKKGLRKNGKLLCTAALCCRNILCTYSVAIMGHRWRTCNKPSQTLLGRFSRSLLGYSGYN
jgi:hypothetical protein